MWQTLEGEKRNGATVETLKVFLGAVMKIVFAPEVPSAPGAVYGSFSVEGKYSVNQAEATKIHKDFIILYLNRKAYNSPAPTKPGEEEYSFKPSLCEHSVTLANSAREKHGGSKEQAELKPADHVEMLNQAKKELDA